MEVRDRAPLPYLEELPHCRLLCRRGLLPSQGCRSVPGKAPPRTWPPGFIRELRGRRACSRESCPASFQGRARPAAMSWRPRCPCPGCESPELSARLAALGKVGSQVVEGPRACRAPPGAVDGGAAATPSTRT